MSDSTANVYNSPWLFTTQYRGVNGNPDNCISFKMRLGDPAFQLEADAPIAVSGLRFVMRIQLRIRTKLLSRKPSAVQIVPHHAGRYGGGDIRNHPPPRN